MRLADNPNLFANSPLDRSGNHRRDTDWLDDAFEADAARIAPFWRAKPLLNKDGPGPAWLTGFAKRAAADAPRVYLGKQGDIGYFAVDISDAPEDAAAQLGEIADMRAATGRLSPEEAAILGQGRSIIDWHYRHRFCAKCGAATMMEDAGAKRVCGSCGAEHFPRVDPVAIMLAVKDDKCLLGRSPHFPPGMYSALAGFVEPGETGEEAAVREVEEEAGVQIDNVRYCFSQPWPFPSSLMMGFIAEAATEEITLDDELEDAKWFDRNTLRALVNGERRDDLFIPPPLAIAHQLIKLWTQERA
ncbi:MAG: NAD(+) diphosphatase [Pseudomonadota bacterium]